MTYCKLNFVDLAGSERTKKSGVTGQALKEAQYINRSLSFLEQTVNSLSRKEAHVPFRQTKLTAVLKDALGGNCKTVGFLFVENVHWNTDTTWGVSDEELGDAIPTGDDRMHLGRRRVHGGDGVDVEVCIKGEDTHDRHLHQRTQ